MSARFDFEAELWRSPGEAGWHFVTLPKQTSDEMRALTQGMRNPFGSLRVIARTGKTTWRTSVFADTKAGAFLLPVKADVRRKEKLAPGARVRVRVEIDL
ncbi:MAG: DUF1905 domain-containing protein [Hyphomonadaceae bacterium]